MKIFCVGKNYAAHAKEMNSEVPTSPLIFMKPPTALLPFGKPFYYPDFSNNIHYELELVIKINRQGKSIKKDQALSFIDEISLGIDFTARDIQDECKKNGHPWEVAKSFDYSASIGQFISSEEVELGGLQFKLLKNGETVQQADTSDMIYNIPTIIEYISHRFTLQRGDLIYTGTPSGVGPIKKGDVLEGFLSEQKLLDCEIR